MIPSVPVKHTQNKLVIVTKVYQFIVMVGNEVLTFKNFGTQREVLG